MQAGADNFPNVHILETDNQVGEVFHRVETRQMTLYDHIDRPASSFYFCYNIQHILFQHNERLEEKNTRVS